MNTTTARTPLAIAADYTSRGWAVVPIATRAKRPTRNDWQRMRLATPDLPAHFNGQPQNIGVLLGEPSGWLVDVDLDHELAVELADEFLPPTASEFGRLSKRRSHRLYRTLGPIETRKRQTPRDAEGGRQMLVELRSTGCQTVFPGSVHPSGETIEWTNDDGPAWVDPDELLAAVNALADEVERRLGIARSRPQQTQQQHHAPRASINVEDRVRRYLARVPGAIQGQGGSDATFAVACSLVLGFDLTPEAAYPLLAEWNERCEPPWSEKELRHKLDDANAKPGDRGYLLNAPIERQPTGTTAEPAASEPVKFSRITSRQLAEGVYDLDYIVAGFLVANQPCILAGPKKALKTTTLIAMAVAIASGVPFLDRFSVATARRVLVMSGESGMATLQETAKRICDWHKCELADLDNLLWSPDLPQIARVDHLDALGEMLREDEIEVLILDPAYLCIPSDDTSNLFAMGALLGNLVRVCQEAGVTCVLAHHTRKGNIADPFEPPELEHIAFAGFQEFARQWILVGRREKYEPGTGEHRLWLSTGGSAGHSGLWGVDVREGTNTAAQGRSFDCIVMTAADAFAAAERAAEKSKAKMRDSRDGLYQNKMLRALFDHPEGKTRNALRDIAGLNSSNGNRIVEQLLASGQIVPCEVPAPNRKTPYEGVRLSDDERERVGRLVALEHNVERYEDGPSLVAEMIRDHEASQNGGGDDPL